MEMVRTLFPRNYAADMQTEVLKQPLQTSITIDVLEFEDFTVEEELKIEISVKDFRAIVVHAETLRATINVLYSQPSHPMQLEYFEHGMHCRFVLATVGNDRGASATPAPIVSQATSTTPALRRDEPRPSARRDTRSNSLSILAPRAPPSRSFGQVSTSQRSSRPSPPPSRSIIDHQSLFVSEDEEDSRWAEKDYEQDGDELGWASTENVSLNLALHYLRMPAHECFRILLQLVCTEYQVKDI